MKEKIKFTYEDYLHLPDDGKRYQVIEGEVYMVPAPAPFHQDILRRLMVVLGNFVESRGLGRIYFAPCDVILSEENVVQPDIFFIFRERESIITEKNIQGAPYLIVEVLSPYTAKLDKSLKRELYEKFEVREYWLVDPDNREVEILTLKEGCYHSQGIFTWESTFQSPLLKGLKVNLADIFK